MVRRFGAHKAPLRCTSSPDASKVGSQILIADSSARLSDLLALAFNESSHRPKSQMIGTNFFCTGAFYLTNAKGCLNTKKAASVPQATASQAYERKLCDLRSEVLRGHRFLHPQASVPLP